MGWKSYVIVALLFFTGGGCAQDWSLTYAPGKPARIGEAPVAGDYDLYTGGQAAPARAAVLFEGEPVGFARDEQGQLLAVAGAERWPIPEGGYRWHRSAQTDASTNRQKA